jgi:DNA-binding CsgD family transcriptional regulator
LATQDVVDTPSGTYRLRVRPLSASDGRTGAVVSVERTSLLPPPGAIRERFDLTPREAEVALLLAEGVTDAEIAEGLFISVHTARRHSGQVLKKLDVSSRAAVAMALLRGGPAPNATRCGPTKKNPAGL